MSKLLAQLASLDDLPESIDPRELYEEKGGAFVLSGVEGLPTKADIDRLQKAIAKERDESTRIRDRSRAYEELGDLEALRETLDRVPELELAAQGKIEDLDAKIAERAEARAKAAALPLQRERDKLASDRDTLAARVAEYEEKDRRRVISDALSSAADKAKILPEAREDLLLRSAYFEIDESGAVVTRDGLPSMPAGVGADVFLSEMRERAPHWWPASAGSGGRGGGGGAGAGGSNPFKRETWNVTEQAKMQAADPDKAKRMMAAAGVDRLGVKPAAKG